jgi:hypothetical protein
LKCIVDININILFLGSTGEKFQLIETYSENIPIRRGFFKIPSNCIGRLLKDNSNLLIVAYNVSGECDFELFCQGVCFAGEIEV